MGRFFTKSELGRSNPIIEVPRESRLNHRGVNLVRNIREGDRMIIGKETGIFLIVLNYHYNF